MKKILVIFALCMFSFVGMGDVLNWQITGSENARDGDTREYISDVYSFLVLDEEIGVRLAAYDRDGNFIQYLHPMYRNPSDPYAAGTIDYEFDDEYIGTKDNLPTGPRQAMYDGTDPIERLFQIQIGNYDEDFNFNPILFSDGMIVDSRYRHTPGDLSPYDGEWSVMDFYTINLVSPDAPEPNSFILLSLGICLLGLRRRRKLA